MVNIGLYLKSMVLLSNFSPMSIVTLTMTKQNDISAETGITIMMTSKFLVLSQRLRPMQNLTGIERERNVHRAFRKMLTDFEKNTSGRLPYVALSFW